MLRPEGIMRKILLFLLACFLLSACEGKKEEINIGLSINLSGRGGTAGGYIRDGAMLAVEQINKSGGINGKRLNLIIKDDKNSLEGVKKADEELVNMGVKVIIGHSTSANSVRGYNILSKKDVIQITAYTAASKLSDIDDNFFRTSVDTKLYGKTMSKYFNENGIKNISILMDMSNENFVEDIATLVDKGLSGKVKKVKFNIRKEIDWDRILAELTSDKPDAILFLTEVSVTGISVQKLKKIDYQGKLFATLWAQSPDLKRYGGESVQDIRIFTFISSAYDNLKYKELSKLAFERFKIRPNARFTRGFELINIISDVMKDCENIETSCLKNQLLTKKFNTVMGEVRFNKYGDVIRPVYLVGYKYNSFTDYGRVD